MTEYCSPICICNLTSAVGKKRTGSFLGTAKHLSCGRILCCYPFFLPVGHTHEDIDQAFSRIWVPLRHHDAITLSDPSQQVEEGYEPYGASPSVFHMKPRRKISGLFRSTRTLHATPIQGFTTYQRFRFSTDESAGASDFSGFSVHLYVKKAGSDINCPKFRSTAQSRTAFLMKLPDSGKTPDFLVRSPYE